MHQIAKSLLTVTFGLGLNAAAFAQSAPSETVKPQPTHKPSSGEHEKPSVHKASGPTAQKSAAPAEQPAKSAENKPAVRPDAAHGAGTAQPIGKPLQPLAAGSKSAGKHAPETTKALPASGAPTKPAKPVGTSLDKPETSVGTSKTVK